MGIGAAPAGWSVPDYVLSKFRADELDEIETATSLAARAAVDWASRGIDYCMNQYNVKKPAPAKKAEP
jgi:PTH1 family peptidyl-tRNA hydrolase